MNEENNFALVRMPSGAVEKTAPGARRILAVMVSETLGLAQAQRPPAPPVISDAQLESWFQTGHKYSRGLGVPRDYAEAVKWWRKAAEQNHAQAQLTLGMCYESGRGVAKDEVEAVKWCRKAAEQNNADAQSMLGTCYAKGQGVAKDDVEAVKWFRKAAEQNDAGAQSMLALCYGNGEGVQKDVEVAVKWYRKAAEQNNAGAQSMLALCYEYGKGVVEDYVEAYAWYNLPAMTYKPAAKNRDDLEKKMSPQQIADALKRTKELRAQIEAKLKSGSK